MAATALLLLLAFAFVQIQQHILRHRAEKLLADLRTLQPGTSTLADTRKFLDRWKPYGDAEEKCTSDHCYLSFLLHTNVLIELNNELHLHLPEHFLFGSELLFGARIQEIFIYVVMDKNIVYHADYSFFLLVPAYASQFNHSSYGLFIMSVEQKTFGPDANQASSYLHPTYQIGIFGGCMGCIKFEAKYTPDIDPAKLSVVNGINFDCITRFWPCTQQSDVMPAAWAESKADSKINGNILEMIGECKAPLDYYARESKQIAIIENQSEPIVDKETSAIRYKNIRLIQELRGEVPLPLTVHAGYGEVDFYNPSADPEFRGPDSIHAGHRYILLMNFDNHSDPPSPPSIAIEPCGLIDLTNENLAAVKRGIQDAERLKISHTWD